jgi:hypothetical protein
MGAGWNSTNNYRLPEITYDKNGNIETLHRNNESGSPLDRFAYEYLQGNRLNKITNTASGTQTYNYGYDNNGNVTSDQFRGISGITYNISNLPEQLTANSSLVKYWYDNNGNRFRKQEGALDEIYVLGINGETEAVFDINGTPKFFNILSGNEILGRFIPGAPMDLYLSNTTLNGTYEAQNSITVEDNVTVGGPTTLKAGNSIHLKPGFSAPSGIDFTAKIETVSNVAKRFYYLKDHLGSIRVVVNEAGEIVSSACPPKLSKRRRDDYDPCLHAEVRSFACLHEAFRRRQGTQAWGMILTGRSTEGSYLDAKYKFTSKERDDETGYDYFVCPPKLVERRRRAGYYVSRIGRWLNAVPLHIFLLRTILNTYCLYLISPITIRSAISSLVISRTVSIIKDRIRVPFINTG